ncbi:hypothetical protein ACOSP7_022818 [Xanthoceras sorbifolium]
MREERESPFMEEIAPLKILSHVKITRKDMCSYNGTGYSDDHLDAYLDWMNMQEASDALNCKIFPLTLVGDARTWIKEISRVKGKLEAASSEQNAKKPWFNKAKGKTRALEVES